MGGLQGVAGSLCVGQSADLLDRFYLATGGMKLHVGVDCVNGIRREARVGRA